MPYGKYVYLQVICAISTNVFSSLETLIFDFYLSLYGIKCRSYATFLTEEFRPVLVVRPSHSEDDLFYIHKLLYT